MMKKLILLFLSVLLLSTCQKATELTISGPQKVEIGNGAYTFTVTVSSNKVWTARAAEAWVHVVPFNITTPSDKPVEVKITIDENNAYDVREAVVTFTAEELTRSIPLKQEGKHALVLPNESRRFEVAAEGKTIDVEVWTNADYEIVIPADCNWIQQVTSKALPIHHHSFQVKENGSRHERVGTIEFINTAENFRGVVEIKQNYYPILVSRDTLRASGRGWMAVFETVNPAPDDYDIYIDDRWLAMEGSEKTADHSRFFVNVQALDEGSEPRDSRILVFYKGLEEPDTLVVHQYAPLPAISYTTSERKVEPPVLEGDKAVGFVFWGDGSNDIWRKDLSHTYGSSGEHTVVMELTGVRMVNFTDLKDEMTINMRELLK